MTSIQFFVDEIKKIYAITDDFAVGSYYFNESMSIEISNIAELACSVSSKLNLENWFLCANDNYFVLEIDDKYIIVYFADDRIDDNIEIVIRRCNNNIEYNNLMLEIT
jgi:hypothetical protein